MRETDRQSQIQRGRGSKRESERKRTERERERKRKKGILNLLSKRHEEPGKPLQLLSLSVHLAHKSLHAARVVLGLQAKINLV